MQFAALHSLVQFFRVDKERVERVDQFVVELLEVEVEDDRRYPRLVAQVGEVAHFAQLDAALHGAAHLVLSLHYGAAHHHVRVDGKEVGERRMRAAEERYLCFARLVLDLDYAVRVAGLARTVAYAGHNAARQEVLPLDVLQVLALEVDHRRVDDHLHLEAVHIERMSRHVHAHHRLLAVQSLHVGPRHLHFGQHGPHDGRVRHVAEERVLLHLLVGLVRVAVAHEYVAARYAARLGESKELLALHVAQLVEGSRVGQALNGFPVARLEVHALHEVEDALVRTVLVALAHDGLHGSLAHAFHAAQAKEYLALLVHCEVQLRLVDVGRLDLQSHRLALVHELLHLAYVVLAASEQRSHELGRIVGLEISRLVRHPRVARGMRLVEGVGGELLPVAPYLVEHLRVVAVLLAALDELGLHGVDYVLLLLTHGLAQRIALASCETRQLTR